MIDKIVDKELCTGCSLCYNICPMNAIKMKINNEGFFYPTINSLCIECEICKKKCPVNNARLLKNHTPKNCYAAQVKDLTELKNSSSGGMFSVFAKDILNDQGAVYGACQEQLELYHIRVDNSNDLKKMQKSKYYQSDIHDCFAKIKNDLENNVRVLFVGTPCQVAAIKNFIGNNENLYLIDILCHGVTSKKVIKKYIESKEKEFKGKITDIFFRYKDFKTYYWENSSNVNILLDNVEKVLPNENDTFYQGFINNIFLRESCYKCQFVGERRVGDVTIGDFWGFNSSSNCLEKKYGISCVLINNKKGQFLFDNIKENVFTEMKSIDDIKKYNLSLMQSVNITKYRSLFFNKIDTIDFDKLIKSFLRYHFFKQKVKKMLNPKTTKLIKKIKGLLKNE